MKKRNLMFLGGIALLVTTTSFAEDKIQAFRTADGKVIYTNAVDNAPAPKPTVVAASPTSVTSPAKSSDPVHALIDSIATNHGVDPALVRAVIQTESNFNRWAVSPKGARGLMQLIPETGARYGVRDFFDPRQNIEGGVRYMKFLLEKFDGNLDLSLAAYNAGEGLVEKLGRVPPIAETREYVRKVRTNYGKASIAAAKAAQVASPETQKPASKQTFRTVDERGVVYFSNGAPRN
jgi:soluble lytic murein transglycosylase-like protein